VEIEYRTEDALKKVKVCELLEGNNTGVGIFTPKYGDPITPEEDKMYFFIKVNFPAAKYRAVTTDLPHFIQSFSPLDPRITFDSVTLKGAHALIEMLSWSSVAKAVTVSNANGEIGGTFRATNSLKLETTYGVIQVAAYVNHTGEVDASNLTISNVNGRIISDIFLNTPNNSEYSGRYNVLAKNANCPTDLRIYGAPVNYVLNVTSKNSRAQSYVLLHQTFEGTFSLGTMPLSPTIIDTPMGKAEDPTGKNRERRIQFTKPDHWIMKGAVSWVDKDDDDEEKKEYGNVKIENEYGEARLGL